jgi:hypothetical protein
MASAARMRAFSSAREFEPGMNRRLRRGWVTIDSFRLQNLIGPAADFA